MDNFRTHYDNLGVTRTADIAVIKAAYKALAQKYHPDRNPNNPKAERIMQIINKAYEVLSDPVLRAEHDRWIDEQKNKRFQENFTKQHQKRETHYQNQSTNNKTQQTEMIKNKTSFWSIHGRMRRTTYIILSIPTLFIWGIAQSATPILYNHQDSDILFALIISIIPYSFLLFISIKRLHDCDYKGWWVLVPFVILVIWFTKPTQEENRFGFNPRDKYINKDDYDEIEFEKDYSIFGVILISALLSLPQINQYENNKQDYTSQEIPKIETHNPDTQNLNFGNTNQSQEMQTEQLNQIDFNQAKQDYDNAVADINRVWNNLHPSTREFLKKEQTSINKKREKDCIAYGNTQSSDKKLAKAHRYTCEVPLLNERTEYLKTQLGVVKYVAKPLPQTGSTNKPDLQGVAPLQIKTSGGNHYWVKITHLNGSELASFFIRGGDTLDIEVPTGSYEIKYATGNTWYGTKYLFGEETQYAKADAVLDFEFDGYQYSGYTVELIMQTNGNLHTQHIDANQF